MVRVPQILTRAVRRAALPIVPRHQLAEALLLLRRQRFFDLDLHGLAEGIDAWAGGMPDRIHVQAAVLEYRPDRILLHGGEAQLLSQVGNHLLGIPVVALARTRPHLEAPARRSAHEKCGYQKRDSQCV